MAIQNHSIDYNIYSSTDFKKEVSGLILIEYQGLTAFLNWRPKEFLNYGHLEFFASSAGWDLVTETGYKSIFLPQSETPLTNDDLKEWFAFYCEDLFPVVNTDQYNLF